MNIKNILVVKETREGEFRVALTPKAVASLVAKNYNVLIESQAGLNAGFMDSDYIQSGAKIFSLTSDGFPANTLILRVKRADQEREILENQSFQENTLMMGFLSPYEVGNHVAKWQSLGVTTFSFDLFKTLAIDDPRNVQAAMSCIAGRLALHDALRRYIGKHEVRLTVLGTGMAAFSAALEARKHNIPVQLFGRNEKYREKAELAEITYHVLPQLEQDQAKFIRSHLSKETIVISAARSPRLKAPILIDQENLNALPEYAIVIDLAVSEGGNVVGSMRDKVVMAAKNVSIVNISGYPKAEPRETSEVYAQCMVNFITDVISPSGDIFLENELLRECWVTHNGRRNSSLSL